MQLKYDERTSGCGIDESMAASFVPADAIVNITADRAGERTTSHHRLKTRAGTALGSTSR